MKNLESKLSNQLFTRIHRSYIINISKDRNARREYIIHQWQAFTDWKDL